VFEQRPIDVLLVDRGARQRQLRRGRGSVVHARRPRWRCGQRWGIERPGIHAHALGHVDRLRYVSMADTNAEATRARARLRSRRVATRMDCGAGAARPSVRPLAGSATGFSVITWQYSKAGATPISRRCCSRPSGAKSGQLRTRALPYYPTTTGDGGHRFEWGRPA
jgi:hypothetical protein